MTLFLSFFSSMFSLYTTTIVEIFNVVVFWKAQIDCRFSTFSFCVNNNNNYEDDDDDDVVDYCGKQQLFHTKYDGGIELQSTRSSMSSSQKHCRHHWIKVNSNNQNKTIDRIEHKQSIRYNERDFLLSIFFVFFSSKICS